MTIQTLSKYIYQDLNARIISLSQKQDFKIHIECDDWNSSDCKRNFMLSCFEVIESTAFPSYFDELNFCNNHQLLWNHNEQHGELYYSSETQSENELLGVLWKVHEETFGGRRPLNDYVNIYYQNQKLRFCTGSGGQVAKGPNPILKVYQNALKDKLILNHISTYTPPGGYKALIFDDSFVICKRIEVKELTKS